MCFHTPCFPLLRKASLQMLHIALTRQRSLHPSFHPRPPLCFPRDPSYFPRHHSRSSIAFRECSPLCFLCSPVPCVKSNWNLGLKWSSVLSPVKAARKHLINSPYKMMLQILAPIHTSSPCPPLSIPSNKCVKLIYCVCIVRRSIVSSPPPRK